MKRMLVVAAATTLGVATASTATTAYAADPGTSTTSTTSTTSAAATGCAAGSLPHDVIGRPAALHAGATAGDYIWHDRYGWHLVVTHPTHRRLVFTGTVTADRPIRYVRVRDERNDRVVRNADGTTIAFRFVNRGWLDGVDFGADCAGSVRFSLRVAGHRLPARRVFLGTNGVHPASDPFVVSRS